MKAQLHLTKSHYWRERKRERDWIYDSLHCRHVSSYPWIFLKLSPRIRSNKSKGRDGAFKAISLTRSKRRRRRRAELTLFDVLCCLSTRILLPRPAQPKHATKEELWERVIASRKEERWLNKISKDPVSPPWKKRKGRTETSTSAGRENPFFFASARGSLCFAMRAKLDKPFEIRVTRCM